MKFLLPQSPCDKVNLGDFLNRSVEEMRTCLMIVHILCGLSFFFMSFFWQGHVGDFAKALQINPQTPEELMDVKAAVWALVRTNPGGGM